MSEVRPPDDPAGRSEEETPPAMSLARASWSLTALVFVAGAIALLIRNDYGYAIVTFVIAVGAAINLAP